VCATGRKAKKLFDNFRNVPRQVKQLTRDLTDWEMLLRQSSGTFSQLNLVNRDVRIQMRQYLDEIEAFVEKADNLIDDHEDRQFLRVEQFVDLNAEFQVQETRLKLWIQLAQL
jgi:regulator of replication initiation timing